MQTGSSSKYILAYDADCSPCTKFRRIVDILDKHERIDFISLTKADQEGLLDKIPVHKRYLSFHLIFPKGDAKSGSEALLELIAILPGGKMITPIIKLITFQGEKRLWGRFTIDFQDCMIEVRVALTNLPHNCLLYQLTLIR